MTNSSFIPQHTPPFSEDDTSKIPALALLCKLGYQYISPKETLESRGGRTSQVILFGILEQQLRKMNRIDFRGESVPFSEGNIIEAIRTLRDVDNDGLVRTNAKIWQFLRLGKSLPQTIQGDTKSFTLNCIDWKNPQNNVYHVTDEFVVEASGSTDTRRPDIVLFVNGIPFCVIECKRPGLPAGKDPIEEGILQQIRNQNETEIPKLFHYSQLLLALASNAARYGTTGTPLKFWAEWKEREIYRTRDRQASEAAIASAIANLVNQPLLEAQLTKLFTPDRYRFRGTTAEKARQWFATLQQQGRTVTAQDVALYALCRPERLLELADKFTVFDAGERKIARYQQYFCVKRLMQRISTLTPDGTRPGGVVWHTQGSGKSLTMVMLAEAIISEPTIKNPRLVLVTDRVDLDDQIYRTFDSCGAELIQARTGKHLQQLLDDPKARIITTLINKFNPNISQAEEDLQNKLERVLASRDYSNTDRDIFVLVDESHRTQFGSLHTSMKRVLPNACFIGFTGTPIMKRDRSTLEKFGGIIDDPYTIDKAVSDGAVVPLLYEGRHVPQQVNNQQIDLWFERYTAGITEAQRANLKKKFSTVDRLNSTEQKIAAIAWDISYHYQTEWQGTGFKAQLVTPSKADALLYKRYLDEFNMVTSEVLISPPDVSEGSTDNSEISSDAQRPKVQEFWNKIIERYGSEKEYQRSVIDRFQHSDEPEIIIVVDKLLTGFDAPRNTVLYLTRSLKEHTLLQAIARVNRLHEGKEFGYIIDYYGVLKKLGDALDIYSSLEEKFDKQDVENIISDISQEWHKTEQHYSDVWELFQTVPSDRKSDIETLETFLHESERRHKFYERLSQFARTMKVALSSLEFYERVSQEKIDRYKADLKFFSNLRASAARRYAETINFREYQASIQKLLDTHVGSGEIETIIAPVNIFDKEAFQAEIEGRPSLRAKAELIANRTKVAIDERMGEDPAFYQQFSKMLEEAIEALDRQRIDDKEYLRRVEDICDKVRDRTGDDVPSSLRDRDVVKAYYGIVKENLAEIALANDNIKEICAQIALKIESCINERRVVNWTENIDIQNQMKTAIEDAIFAVQDRYNFELDFDAIDRILEKCIDIARLRLP